MIKWKVMLPLYSNQISLLTVLAAIHRSSLQWPPVYTGRRNVVLQAVVIHRFDCITNENNKEHNEKWPYIPDYPYRILIIGGSGAGKTNTLINLINEQDDINKIYLYAKDLSKPKYEFLLKKRKNAGIKHLNDLNAFTECSNTMMTFVRVLMIKNQTEKKI